MKALALFSGGLDSMLAIKLMADQGIEVIALHVNIGFGSKTDRSDLLRQRVEKAGGRLEIIDAREAYIQEILFSPKYGYGKHFNPCIDCHGFMFGLAKSLLPRFDARFIVTGEVIGQRPMSQRVKAIRAVTALAGDDEGLIVRPLSAKLMEETLPEKMGWIDREKLLDISGRTRERQFALAKAYGFEEYETPGGGCLLTLKAFSDKLKDACAHHAFEVQDIDLLKHGRHLRLPEGAKLVIGRDASDNARLEALHHDRFEAIDLLGEIGPYALLENNASPQDTELALRLVLTYAKTSAENRYNIAFKGSTFCLQPFASRAEARPYFVS